jgi:ABC-type lipoprotein export system ATPase subunit
MLQLKDIKKSFREPDGGVLPILDIARFEVKAGEQMVLTGDSGCGKTTLLHVIAGLSRPDSGEVRIDGTNITLLPEAGRDQFRAAKIGYVFQTFNLLPGFSALENVVLGMTFGRQRSDASRARQLLERVGLGNRLSHKPAMLSVGEQQRVAVARALVMQPSLLLADEPTGDLDETTADALHHLLREMHAEFGLTAIIATHNPRLAQQCDRILRLEGGSLTPA